MIKFREIMAKLVFLLLQFILFLPLSCSAEKAVEVKREVSFPEVNLDHYDKINTIYGDGGEVLGDLYVMYRNELQIVLSIVIVKNVKNKSELLYVIEKENFINTDGLDFEVYKKGFYGYQITGVGNGYFSILYYMDCGDSISDPISIAWEDGVFKVLKTP